MKGITSKIFGSSKVARPLQITEQSVPLHYALSSFRWHQDIRPPMKIIAVHDFLSCAGAWERTFNTAMADLPLSNNSPRDPLEIYSVELRGHNYSENALTSLDPQTYVSACAADLVRVQQEVLRSEACLVGIGFGSMVSAAAMLHAPHAFTSAVLFVNALSDLYTLDPTRTAYREAIGGNLEAPTFRGLNDGLKSKGVADDVDRALLLSMADQLPAKTRLRLHKDLLAATSPLCLTGHESAVSELPVTVYVPTGCTPTADEMKLFTRNFPHGTVFEHDGTLPLPASDPKRSRLIAESLHVLEDMQAE